MKKILKLDEPAILRDFREQHPDATWEQFKNECQEGYHAVQAALRQNQRKLCAYCENDMLSFAGKGLDDFRVEHFHPKKRPPEPPPNWDLDWRNLLGVCHGGSAKGVGKEERFTAPDLSCDASKGDKILDDVILNPLYDIPAFSLIFKYDEQGGMDVDMEQCPTHLQEKAKNTIAHLNLSQSQNRSKNAKPPKNTRLARFREAVIRNLRIKIAEQMPQGHSTEAEMETAMKVAMEQLADVYFQDNDDSWPRFFSCIRWYLGTAAEEKLKSIGYKG